MGRDAVIRIKRADGFTVLPNSLLRDDRLSLKTKGLFCMMLSFPGDWTYSVGGLVSVCGAGRDAVRGALRELEVAGYLDRERVHSEDGRFSGMVYTLHEISSIPRTENPSVDDAQCAPWSDFPTSEKPTSENPTLQNKDNTNTPYSPPGGACAAGPVVDAKGGNDGPGDGAVNPNKKPASRRRSGPKDAPDWKPERFAGFWEYYPRGESKQAAIRAWDRLRPSDELIDEMAQALRRQMESESWRAGVGIPYASTWLNNQRWTDVPKRSVAQETSHAAPLRGEGVQYQ